MIAEKKLTYPRGKLVSKLNQDMSNFSKIIQILSQHSRFGEELHKDPLKLWHKPEDGRQSVCSRKEINSNIGYCLYIPEAMKKYAYFAALLAVLALCFILLSI